MLNKKGMTLLEIVISIALISVVMLFLFSLLNDIQYESKHSSYAKDFLVSRATIIKDVEEYLLTNLGELTRFSKAQIETKQISELEPSEVITQKLQIIIPQMRLDCIVSESIRCSRTNVSEIIKQERVFVNHKLETKNSKILHEQDMITIRGKGRFKINNIISRTKKDKIVLEIEKYV